MADVTVKVLTAATNFDLMTLEELKTALGITDVTQDALLNQLIDRYSDWVSERCNRVFAKETVRETWRCNGTECPATRIYLTYWPVKEEDITLVEAPKGVVIPSDGWELEERSGKLTLWGGDTPGYHGSYEGFSEIVVTYTGGLTLPSEAPDALKQACELMIRAERTQQIAQATAGIRSISHKEARVMFFDPNQGSRSSTTTRTTGVSDAVDSLLMHYTRIQV